MFIKDEQWLLDLEKAKIARTLPDPEEDEAYARIVMKGDIGSNGRNYSNSNQKTKLEILLKDVRLKSMTHYAT